MTIARSAPAAPPRIRIAVAGSQEIDRESLAALLARQAEFTLIGQVATGPAAAELCRTLRPHVVLLDGGLPETDGVPAVCAILAAAPQTRILVLAARSHEQCLVLNPPGRARLPSSADWSPCALGTDCLLLALARGALGAIRRSASAADLFRAIRAVATGAAWIESGTAARLHDAVLGRGARGPLGELTERDLEVAACVAEGRSNKEIARAVGVSEQTVKKHIGRLLARLALEDRLQIGLYFARNPQLLQRDGRPPATAASSEPPAARGDAAPPATLVAPSPRLVGDWRRRTLLRR